jgi:ubiquinone/menaquinone biosynthesis C-methylase UbiE
MGGIEDIFREKGELFLKVMDSEGKRKQGVTEATALKKIFEMHDIKKGGRILEVGCGSGRVAIPLSKLGYEVYGVDFSDLYIYHAKKRAEEEQANTHFILRDIREGLYDLFKEDYFDAAYMIWTTIIGYYEKDIEMQLYREIYSIVKAKGIFVVANTMHRDHVAYRNTVCRGATYDEIGDYVVIDIPKFDPIKSRIESEWRFYRIKNKNLEYIDSIKFMLNVYTVSEIINMIEEGGWRLSELYGDIINLSQFKPSLSGFNAVFTKPV